MAGGAERGNRRTAAEADEVLQEGVGLQAELLGDVAGHTGAEIPAAGADEQRIEFGGFEAGLSERGGEGASGEFRGFGAEDGVELVGGQVEDVLDVGCGKVPVGDAVFAAQDGLQDEHRALLEARPDVGALREFPALGLGEGRGRNGGGEGVEMHAQ